MPIEYAGPERRRRHVYVTHNTEYYVHDGVCIAVRDRRSGEFQRAHLAMGHRLKGAVSHDLGGYHVRPQLGDSMLLQAGKHEVITSPLERVTRPPRDLIDTLPG